MLRRLEKDMRIKFACLRRDCARSNDVKKAVSDVNVVFTSLPTRRFV